MTGGPDGSKLAEEAEDSPVVNIMGISELQPACYKVSWRKARKINWTVIFEKLKHELKRRRHIM